MGCLWSVFCEMCVPIEEVACVEEKTIMASVLRVSCVRCRACDIHVSDTTRPMRVPMQHLPVGTNKLSCVDIGVRHSEYSISCDVWLRVAVFIRACVARMLYLIKLYTYTYEWLGGIDH